MRRRGGLSLERRRRRCNENAVGNRRLGDGARSTRRDRLLSAIICVTCGSIFAINNRGRWSFTWRSLRSGRGMPRPYTDMPPTGPPPTVCVGVSGRRSRSPLCIVGVNLRNLRFGSLSLGRSRSTIGVDGRSPGGLYNLGEACLAPTQICPLLDRYCVRGRFRAPFPFAPAHSQRQSAKSAVRCSLGPEHSRSTIGVDGRSPGGLYEVGEARLAPTQICPRRERDGVGVAFHGTPLCSSAPT